MDRYQHLASWLLALGLVAGLASSARADGILFGGSLTTSATGSYTVISSATTTPYNNSSSGDPTATNPLNLSSSGSLQYVGLSVLNIQSAASGSAQASPDPGFFTSLDVSLSASAGNLNNTSMSGATSSVAANSQYTASFTLTDTEQFTLSLTADSSFTQTLLRGQIVDPGSASATLTSADTNQVIGAVSSSSDLNSSDGLQTFTLSGILDPGTYSIDAQAAASSEIEAGAVNISSSGNAAFDLTLSPVPEPASALMLVLGGLGCFLHRRFKRAV